ncbi:helix-turn-helix domain-containing protein [Xylella fastidiosa]|uniref:helix-turn-helix domain-containing protein n=1 Tax=Xylella fastidiosa TaxID=2371 RepID=UPI000765DACD|nr:helix-turn-helix domain-containing protein [Xylella fastidiosa]KXB19094.1 hypothetical protein ADT30_09730 [Xylella fastidiosa]
MDITKRVAREFLGFTMDRQLADFFGVSKAAVSKWPENQGMPEVRQWQLRALRPDVFGAPPTGHRLEVSDAA